MNSWNNLNLENYNNYISSIINNRGQWNISEGEYFEAHHIIFRCYGGKGKKRTKHENIIWLYPEEHFIAHKILAEDNPLEDKIIKAWSMMAFPGNNNEEIRKDLRELFPEEYAYLRKNLNASVSEETIQKRVNTRKNRSEEEKAKTREKIRATWDLKLATESEEEKQKRRDRSQARADKMTPEQKKAQKEKEVATKAARPEELKQAQYEKQRQKLLNKTEEERAEINRKWKETKANKSEEEKALEHEHRVVAAGIASKARWDKYRAEKLAQEVN